MSNYNNEALIERDNKIARLDADYKALEAKCESLEYHGQKMAEEIGSLTAELAECRKALIQIRDSTFRNATTLRGIANNAIARSKA